MRSPRLAALSTILAILHLNAPANAADVVAGGVVFSPEAVDFGEVSVGDSVVLEVDISNQSGKRRFLRSKIKGGESPFSLESAAERDLFDNELGVIFVEFTPQVAGVFSTTLQEQVRNHQGELLGTAAIPLDGIGTGGTLAVDFLELDYGDVLLGSKPLRKITLTNISGASVKISNAKAGAKPFALKQIVDDDLVGVELPHILGVGESIDILVRFKPKQEGSFSGDLEIKSEGFPNKKLRIPLRGNGVAELGLSHHKKINFGKVATNVFHQRSLVLMNHGDRELTGKVVTKNLSDEFFTVIGDGEFSLAPGATKNVVFEFGATGECEHEESIKIVSDGLLDGKAKLKVSVESVDD